jgi:hypothetical protein
MMRIRDAMILVFLLCLVEALSVNMETMTPSPGGKVHVLSRLSAGFPFRFVEYTRPDGDTPNPGSASKDAESDARVRIERPLLVCDALAMALLGVFLATLTLPVARRALATEVMVGVVAGALVLGLGDHPTSSHLWLSNGIGIVVLLVAIPLSVCVLSGRHQHPNVFLVLLSGAGGLAFVRAGLLAAAAFDGESMFFEPAQRLRPWLVCAGISIVLAGVSFAMRLLGRRVLRRSSHWSRVARTPEASEPCSECNDVLSAKVEKNARRWIVAATILLVVALYVGAHFSVVRDLRDDALSTNGGRTEEAILAKLETLTQPLVGRVRAQIMETVGSSFRGGVNARYQKAILVNGEDLCYASFEKHLLIPWVQVEVFRMGTVADVQQRAMRHRRALSNEPSPARTEGPPATERK